MTVSAYEEYINDNIWIKGTGIKKKKTKLYCHFMILTESGKVFYFIYNSIIIEILIIANTYHLCEEHCSKLLTYFIFKSFHFI